MGILVALLLAGTIAMPERRVLMPFDYQNVRITGGMLSRQLDESKEYYLRIPNDDLLLGFRKRAGLPAPGRELGGWYSADIFHVFGQILSGLARMYAATGDPACREKAGALLDGWKACIAKDGFFYASSKPNAPHYAYDKMVGGLVDMALYAKRPDALQALSTITGWAEKNLDRSNAYAFNSGSGPTEWYTLSENLYRAYLAARDERYRKFAKVWEFTDYWQLYAKGKSIFDKRPDGKRTLAYHAYSHVNNLGGAAMAYRVTGDSWYLDTIEHAYDFLQANECFATGGFGPNESLVPKERLEQTLQDTSSTFETQCGTWAGFKLCKHLISLSGDARYGDWAERLAYNGIGATIPMDAEGRVLYYSDYNPNGGAKRNCPDGWSCCTGTRPMAIADVSDLIYFKAPRGLCVNLFVPSRVSFSVAGTKVEIEQSTRFPEQPSTSFTVRLPHPRAFEVRFRKPSWLSGPMTAIVSGRKVSLSEDSKHWMRCFRTWDDGDTLQLSLPMKPHAVPLYSNKPYPTAIAVGPTVLAFRATSNPAGRINLARIQSQLVQIPGDGLTYRLSDTPDVIARPFYAYKAGEEYFMYLDPAAAGRISYRRMQTSGPWRDSGRYWFCNQPGAWCETSFEGDSVEILGFRYDDGGRGEVRIDGKVVGGIDQYGPGRDLPFIWKTAGLRKGHHTIRITILADKDAESKDRFLNIAGLKITPYPTLNAYPLTPNPYPNRFPCSKSSNLAFISRPPP